jgi:ribosomal protein S18 acetylase RimI-like enzyme
LAFLVREAVPGDAEQMLAGIRLTLAEVLDSLITQAEEFSVTVEEQQAWIRQLIESDKSVLLLTEREGRILSWLVLRGKVRLRERHTAELGITVLREWRDRGVGRALMETALDWAAENPLLEKVKLRVVAGNQRALNLYRQLGFQEEGRQPREYKKQDGVYLDNILMYRFV